MQAPKEIRPTFFDDPASDRLAAIVTAISAEVASTVDRLDTMETLLVRKGLFTPGEIDEFQPTAEDAARRRSRHDAFVSRVFYVIREEFEALGPK